MSILKSIWAWISGAAKKIKEAYGFGHDAANWLKGIADSGVLDTIVAATPWKWDDALLPVFKEFIVELLKDMDIIDQTVTDVDQALTTASGKIQAMGSDAKAIVLAGVNAASASWHASEVNKTTLPIQDALSASQSVYDNPHVLDDNEDTPQA